MITSESRDHRKNNKCVRSFSGPIIGRIVTTSGSVRPPLPSSNKLAKRTDLYDLSKPWTREEQDLFEQLLKKYEELSNEECYTKIAMSLNNKTPMDVAIRVGIMSKIGIGKRRMDNDVELAKAIQHIFSDDVARSRMHIVAEPMVSSAAQRTSTMNVSCKAGATSSHTPAQTKGTILISCYPHPQTQEVVPSHTPQIILSQPPIQNSRATVYHYFTAHPMVSSLVPRISCTNIATPTDDVISEMLKKNELLLEKMTKNVASDDLMGNMDIFTEIRENMIKTTNEMKNRGLMNELTPLSVQPHEIYIPPVPVQYSDIFTHPQTDPALDQPGMNAPSSAS